MEELKKVVEALVEVIKQTANFAAVQLPDIAQQAVAQEVATCWVWIIAAGFVFFLMLVLLMVSIFKDKADDLGPPALIFMLCTMPFLFYNVRDLVRVKTAPKIYVLEYFGEQVRKLK